MWFSLVSFRASIVVAASIDTYTIFFFLFVHAILLSMYRHRGLVCSAASHCITISRLHVRTLYVKRRILGFQTVKVSRFSTRGGRKSSVLTKRLVKQQTQAEEEGVEPWLLGLTAMLHCRRILSWNRGQHLNFLKVPVLFAKVTSREMRGIVTCLEILNYFGTGWKIFWNKDIDNWWYKNGGYLF